MVGKWKPRKKKESYWTIDESNSIDSYWYYGDRLDRQKYYFGNMFRTKKQAEAVLKKIRRSK